jgi:hypothetical protein
MYVEVSLPPSQTLAIGLCSASEHSSLWIKIHFNIILQVHVILSDDHFLSRFSNKHFIRISVVFCSCNTFSLSYLFY